MSSRLVALPLFSRSACVALASTLVLLIVLADAGHAIPPKPKPENSVSWALYREGEGPNKCRQPGPGGKIKAVSKVAKAGEGNHQSCSGFGEFYFDIDASQVPCPPLESGDDVPGTVNPPASVEASGWQPCDDGSCLSDIPKTPWVGVLDWGNAHGWQVAHTIQQASKLSALTQPLEVRMFDVSQSTLPALSDLPHITDAHVLEQLCTFAELTQISADDERVASPLALNMSFGRLDSDPQADPDTPNFAKLTKRLLRYLRKHHDVLEVAAAGNHDELEYPASLTGVVSAGWFDPVVAVTTGELSPGLHSPENVQALTLSHGLVLRPHHQEPGEDPQHFVPLFGSSFSSALVTGWLAGWQKTCDVLEEGCAGEVRKALFAGDSLEIVPIDVVDDDEVVIDTNWLLAIDGVPVVGSASEAFEELAERSIAGVPADWAVVASDDPVEPPTVFQLSLKLLEEDEYELPWLSVADLVKFEKYAPSPGARGMCRPCHRRDTEDQEVRLAFGEHNPLTDNLFLEDVYVEIGDQIYALMAPSNNPGEYYDFMDALQFGDNAELEILNFPVDNAASIGLRFHILRMDDVVRFWDHEPIWATAQE